MSTITIPEPINKEINLRWFVEYVVDNSPLFKTTSAIAKAIALLNSDLDSVGTQSDLPESAHKLLSDALTSEECPLEMPTLQVTRLDDSGNPVGDPQMLPPRTLVRFITALVKD